LLNRLGLSLQQYSLLNILNMHGPTAMTEISEMLSITKPAVTNLADQMEKDDLIVRKPHPGDRRSYLLEIRPQGSKQVERIQDIIFETLSETFKPFRSKEREIVHGFYEKLSENLKRQFQKQTSGIRHE